MGSSKLWVLLATVILVAIALVGYLLLHRRQPQTMPHALTGYVLEVTPAMNRITVRNADIPEMRSMVMDYCVKNAATLAAIHPGDVIQATMIAKTSR